MKCGTHVDSPPTSALAWHSGRSPGLRLKCIAFPGKNPVACWMHRLALTVAGAAQALRRFAAHLIPGYPFRQEVVMAPDVSIFKSYEWISQGRFQITQTYGPNS